MPWPWSTGPRRGAALLDGWLPAGAWRLEHHAIDVAAEPAAALRAIEELRLADAPIVDALFRLRGLSYQRSATLGCFFSTSPFLALQEGEGRELVFGVTGPFWQWRRGRLPPALPRTPDEFRAALLEGRMAAIGNFRAEPIPGGSRLWTETWVHAPRPGQRLLFGSYWLIIGPFSAWIRRLLLAAARRRAGLAAVRATEGK